MSLLLCTARSISPASSASSISFTKSRFPPISESVASASRSPDVLMTNVAGEFVLITPQKWVLRNC